MGRRPRVKKCVHFLRLSFILAFIVFAVGINYFHTDGILERDPLCPACIFQSSVIEPPHLDILPLPSLVVLAVLPLASVSCQSLAAFVVEPARAPPLS